MKKSVAMVVAFLVVFVLNAADIQASPSMAVYVQNKSGVGEKAIEDAKLVEELIKESLKGKVAFSSSENIVNALSASAIIDIEVAERNDIVAALKNEKHAILVSLIEAITSGGGLAPTFINVEIHCRVIDITNNKYLLNTKERSTDTAFSFRKAIRRAMTPIQTELAKLSFAD